MKRSLEEVSSPINPHANVGIADATITTATRAHSCSSENFTESWVDDAFFIPVEVNNMFDNEV